MSIKFKFKKPKAIGNKSLCKNLKINHKKYLNNNNQNKPIQKHTSY